MKPNIGKSGRIARAITGSLCIAGGIAMWLLAWPDTAAYRWLFSLLAIALGVFQLFEAKRGWCVARACGIKTPM